MWTCNRLDLQNTRISTDYYAQKYPRSLGKTTIDIHIICVGIVYSFQPFRSKTWIFSSSSSFQTLLFCREFSFINLLFMSISQPQGLICSKFYGSLEDWGLTWGNNLRSERLPWERRHLCTFCLHGRIADNISRCTRSHLEIGHLYL